MGKPGRMNPCLWQNPYIGKPLEGNHHVGELLYGVILNGGSVQENPCIGGFLYGGIPIGNTLYGYINIPYKYRITLPLPVP